MALMRMHFCFRFPLMLAVAIATLVVFVVLFLLVSMPLFAIRFSSPWYLFVFHGLRFVLYSTAGFLFVFVGTLPAPSQTRFKDALLLLACGLAFHVLLQWVGDEGKGIAWLYVGYSILGGTIAAALRKWKRQDHAV